MRIDISVRTPKETFHFYCIARRSDRDEDRLLGVEFYRRFSLEKKAPEGEHYELELIEPIGEHLPPGILHIFNDEKTGRRFVCITSHMPTVEVARAKFLVWSVGTAYTLLMGEDFAPLFVKPGGDFLAEMKDLYGIHAV